MEGDGGLGGAEGSLPPYSNLLLAPRSRLLLLKCLWRDNRSQALGANMPTDYEPLETTGQQVTSPGRERDNRSRALGERETTG